MTARGSEDQTPDARRLVALLADPARLRVYAALVLADAGNAVATEDGGGNADNSGGGAQPAALAETSGVSVRDVLRALSRFEEAGMAAALKPEEGGGWRAVPEALRAATEANARQRELEDALPGPPVQDPAVAATLRGYFARGRLTHVPLAHAKRMVVLDYLAQAFEPGVRYPEAEVNEMLQKYHDDYAALRRYLVDADFLGRSENVYWRTGGSVGL